MTDQAPQDADSPPTTAAEEPATEDEERIPDESTLMGRSGVEDEIRAELARAEAKMNDPSGADDPDAEGAQV
jgi:hypothetical protein